MQRGKATKISAPGTRVSLLLSASLRLSLRYSAGDQLLKFVASLWKPRHRLTLHTFDYAENNTRGPEYSSFIRYSIIDFTQFRVSFAYKNMQLFICLCFSLLINWRYLYFVYSREEIQTDLID